MIGSGHPLAMPGMPPMPPGLLPPTFALTHFTPLMPMGLMPSHIVPQGLPVPQMQDNRPMHHRNHAPHRKPMLSRRLMEDQRRTHGNQSGPTITVFVGNITDRAPDNMIKHLLQKCGSVVSWKRVQGASGKLQAFGFCEYGDPESALRAMRILHDWDMADKKMVVKVDAKTKSQLDEYKAGKRRFRQEADGAPAGGKTPTESERDDDEEIDEDTRQQDYSVRNSIEMLLKEYEHDLSRPIMPAESRRKGSRSNNQDKSNGAGEDERDLKDKDNLDEMDLEEDKKNLIHREIDKFRDTMKKLEEEKEKEKERREKDRERRDKDRGGDRGGDRGDRDRRESRDPPPVSGANSSSLGSGSSMSNRLHSRSTPDRGAKDRMLPDRSGKDRDRSYDRSRSRSRERERERENRSRERERERDRSRERENALIMERVREKEYEREREKRDKGKDKEREDEEEAYERRKLERKLREKEAAYQERLRNWETRERKKGREYDKTKEKEDERVNDEIKEAKRLKEFLEDYDDERDDSKYYKGSALTRRLKDREKEMDADSRDKQREKEELDELKQRLVEEGHPNPSAEVERIQKETEEMFRPILKIVIEDPPPPTRVVEREREREREVAPYRASDTYNKLRASMVPVLTEEVKVVKASSRHDDDSTQNSFSGFSDITTPYEEAKPPRPSPAPAFSNLKFGAEVSPAPVVVQEAAAAAVSAVVPEEAKPKLMGFSGLKLGSSPTQQQSGSGSNHGSDGGGSGKKRLKLTVGEVFNTDEDDPGNGQARKRKLVPLDYSEDEKKAVGQSAAAATAAAATAAASAAVAASAAAAANPNQEEKRKHIKNLIDKIPTEKEKLFAYGVDWNMVDSVLMERRVKPWINKKIVEYIGEEEPTLVEFICSKLMAGSTPQSILDDVQMVLDDEAEVFVVKMWRLLIYEIEAKKLGLASNKD